MEAEFLFLATQTLLTLMQEKRLDRKRRNKVKRLWVKPWMARKERSVYNNLVQEMRLEDGQGFYDYHRMSKENFNELLNMVSPEIQKQNTHLREAIPPEQRLSVTLRYLATGESRRSLGFQYRISHNLISKIIPEVSSAIFTSLKQNYLKLPTTKEEWFAVAHDFHSMWNFPNCIGAMDGKRFLLTKPSNTGALYYDYKSHHSMIMLALVDANYKFLFVDVGTQGRASDAGVWEKCILREYLEGERLDVPAAASLPYAPSVKTPFVIVGDDAFPLKTYLMKPYPGKDLTDNKRIFNYRLSRARRVSEIAFGILAAKFRVFQQPISSKPEYVKKIIFAAVALHNYLRAQSVPIHPELLEREDVNQGIIVPGQGRQAAAAFERLQVVGRGHGNEAKAVRDTLKSYFMERGKVSWQEQMALLH